MKSRSLAFVTALLIPAAAFAWGQEGHSAIAEIAQRSLSEPAAKAVTHLLGPGVSLASISNWADDARDQHPETYNWHFVDIPLSSKAYAPARDCKSDPKGDCVVAELDRLQSALRCAATPEARREALKWAVHFVGDIHQPMHTVLESKGGNEIHVLIKAKGVTSKSLCTNDCSKSNLHKVWDSEIINKLFWNWGALVEDTQTSKYPLPQPESMDPVVWANATHLIAIDMWNLALSKKEPASDTYVIDDNYLNAAKPLLQQQLSWAGQRLGKFLNQAYSGSQACPQEANQK